MIYNGGRSEQGGNEMTMHLCWETEAFSRSSWLRGFCAPASCGDDDAAAAAAHPSTSRLF